MAHIHAEINVLMSAATETRIASSKVAEEHVEVANTQCASNRTIARTHACQEYLIRARTVSVDPVRVRC